VLDVLLQLMKKTCLHQFFRHLAQELQQLPKKVPGREKNELSESLDRFTEAANNRHKNIVKELQELVQAEKRKNDLFEKFLDTFTKK